MIVTIHQPEHLVWLGLVDKVSQADIFVILDSVQFRKNYFQNRNKIRTHCEEGWAWLTVPLKKQPLETKIKDIEISDVAWKEKYLSALKNNYIKAPFFKDYYPEVEKIIQESRLSLSDLNIKLLLFIFACFGLKNKKIIKSSELGLPENKNGSDLILEICKIIGTETYLSGPSGPDYLNFEDFDKAGIEISVHNFNHPTYTQQFDPFVPFMSSIDLLFNHGPDSKKIIWK